MGSRVSSQFRGHKVAGPDVACEFFLGKRIRLGLLGEEPYMAEFGKKGEGQSELISSARSGTAPRSRWRTIVRSLGSSVMRSILSNRERDVERGVTPGSGRRRAGRRQCRPHGHGLFSRRRPPSRKDMAQESN